MRIGLLSNFWYVRGGLERVMLADAAGLVARGHEVAPFASSHPLNQDSPHADLFPPSEDHGSLGSGMSALGKARTAARLFHNRTAATAFDAFVDRVRPDLVHQHGLARQFSPSVLEQARARGIPTVLTLHDYSLRCPSGDLSRPGAPVCLTLSCAGHRYDRAVRFGCVHGSRVASTIAAVELLEARALRRYERAVDLFLTPSRYVADRMRESGLPADRIQVMPNAVEPDTTSSGGSSTMRDFDHSRDGHVLAFGRLVPVKGFDLVIDVARRTPDRRFVIAGDGPERGNLEARAKGLSNVELTGFVEESAIVDLLRSSAAVLVPSIWPEPFGMVVLEAWREGRAVIVTARGALPEIVEHEVTGLVIEPGDVTAAADAVRRLTNDRHLAKRLGAAGRRQVETTYSLGHHLDRLERAYASLTA